MEISRTGPVQPLMMAGDDSKQPDIDRALSPLKRFGDIRFSHHPHTKGVQKAMESISEDILKRVQTIISETAADYPAGIAAVQNHGGPELTPPVHRAYAGTASEQGALSSSAMFALLMEDINQTLGNASAARLQENAATYNAAMESWVTKLKHNASEFELNKSKNEDADKTLEACQKEAAELSKAVDKAEAAARDADKKLDELLQQAAQVKEGDTASPELLEKIDNARNIKKSALKTLDEVKALQSKFNNEELEPAKKEADEIGHVVARLVRDALNSFSRLTQQQRSVLEARLRDDGKFKHSMAYIMALMSKIMNKSTDKDLEGTAKFKDEMAIAAANDAKAQAKKYEEEVRKAEEMQKTMGCIGKVIGWAVTVIGFAAAAFTGGASLALAAVGLALTVGDEIDQAVTGKSFIADAMKPVMENIIKPLMDALGKVFTAALEELGVDKSKAELAGQIMGAVSAAIVMIVGAVLIGSAASKLVGVVMERLGSDVAQEVAKDMVKEVAEGVEKDVIEDLAGSVMQNTVGEATQNISEKTAEKVVQKVAGDVAGDVTQDALTAGLEETETAAAKSVMQRIMQSTLGKAMGRVMGGAGKAMGLSDEEIAQFTTRADIVVMGLTVTDATIESTGNILVANMEIEAEKAKAKLILDSAMQKILSEMMDLALEIFTRRLEAQKVITEALTDAIDKKVNTNNFIIGNIANLAC